MLHSMDTTTAAPRSTKQKSNPLPLILVIILAIVLGIGTGYFIKQKTATATVTSQGVAVEKKGNVTSYGTKDTKLYPDSATGTLREGGIEGEGTSHLERPGGPSQNVYLTSSTVDLGTFTGKKVTVWGKTYAGNKAGWLMDVGYIEVQ